MRNLSRIIGSLALILLLWMAGAPAYAQTSLALDPTKALTQYPLDTWEIEDGLPQNTITSVTQTSDGYIWLGTQEGLVRFDGLRFTVFDKANLSLRKNNIAALKEDRNGVLWIGMRNGGGLTYYKDGVFTAHPLGDSLTTTSVSALFEDEDGTLWVGTFDDGIFLLKGDKMTHFTTSDGLPSNHISAISHGSEDRVWIGTRDAGVVGYRNAGFQVFTSAHGLPSNEVRALYTDRDSALWVGTRGAGLARYKEGRFKTYSTDDGLVSNKIETIMQDRVGSLWVGTADGGLNRFAQGVFSALTVEDGLSNGNVSSLFEDREGSLWIGTGGGGLNRIWNGKFTSFTTMEGLGGDNAHTVYESQNGAVLIGGIGGGLSRYRDGHFKNLSTEDGLASDNVISLTGTSKGVIWIGTLSNGVTRYKDDQITNYTMEDGLAGNKIYGLYTDSRDVVWFATESGVGMHDGRRFSILTVEDGLTSNYPTAFDESKDGSIWIGTYDGGLNRYKDGRVIEHYTQDNGLGGNCVLALHEDEAGVLWISIREAGLYRFEDGTFTAYNTANGLFNDSIVRILEDDQGYFWMTSNKGLFRVSKAELQAVANGSQQTITSVVYDKADGLTSREFNGGVQPAGWKVSNGELWFPTHKGVVVVDPANLPSNTTPPLVRVEQVLVDGEEMRMVEGIELAPGSNKFEFSYVGLSFIAAEKVMYQYMLEGEDEAWVDAGNRRVAYYNNLSPGSYRFRVRAKNSDGVWSEANAQVGFYLKPFFYQTTWFLLLCIVASICLSVGFYSLRVRQLKERQRMLEQTVEERTKDLREEKEKTEEALQQTEQARREAEHQREIAEEAKGVIEEQADKLREMDRIKTRFFSNISHEFRTPLTLNIGPLENALSGAYGPINKTVRTQLEVMLRNSRRLLRLINQLLDLSKLESGRMKLKAQRGNVVDLVEGVVLSFTAFAQHEGIKLEIDTPKSVINLYYDPHHLEKVFFNLLSNAIKFTPEGGEIRCTISPTTVEHEGATYEAINVAVSDTGQGIPAEALPTIFDRFSQVDGSVSKVQEGTGIGLSLVKELVELHSGFISVESEVGKGTCFNITLLAGKEHLGDIEILEPTMALESTSMGAMVELSVFDESDIEAPHFGDEEIKVIGDRTILVVDDNPDIRAYVSSCLEARFKVVRAKDGLDGFQKAREVRPDLIVSDVMMPRMNGYELCRAIKKDEELNHIPLVLLTSKASTEARIEGLEAGADDYLHKPFNAKELFARVGNLLNLRAQQSELKELNGELTKTNEALVEANELKSQLLSIASHDMKNPLMAVREFTRIIKSEIDDESHLVEFLDLIYRSTDQMLHLVTQLLDSAALENGKLVLNLEPLSLRHLTEAVIYSNQKQAEAKGQQIRFEADADNDYVVEADRDRIHEALENLISNAIKYSPFDKDIWVELADADDEVLFKVRDEGPGLTDDDKEKLFGKFQKLSARPTGEESSTGLGLSIVKQILELHEGRVWADSVYGQGSTFTIALKAHPNPDRAGDREAQPPSRKGARPQGDEQNA